MLKKPNEKDYMLHDTTGIKIYQSKTEKQKAEQWLPGLRDEDWTTKGHEGTSWGDGNVPYHD